MAATMRAHEPGRQCSSKILLPGSAEYEAHRRNNARGDSQGVFPQEIHVVFHADGVVAAVKRATQLGTSIGVRSGGHSFSNPGLYGGVMMDVSGLNGRVDYDPTTQEVSFGPGIRVRELGEALASWDRFYPHGHCPSVAAGGFHLGAGQGVGMRAWGPTYRDWLLRLEVVVPDGRIVMASRTENQDLFWAARGSGPAFFGIITRYWGRTMRRSQWWSQLVVFDLQDNYKLLMTWFIEQSKTTPKKTTELNALVVFPDKARAKDLPDRPPMGARLQFVVSNIALADSAAEAQSMLGAYELIPDDLTRSLISTQPVCPYGVETMWSEQDMHWHSDGGELWRSAGLAIGHDVDLDKFLQVAEPRLTDVPTLRSVSWATVTDWEPDEQECAFSIPMRLYMGSLAGWRDRALTLALDNHWRSRYRDLLPFSSGMMASDYDVERDDMNSIPLSTTALARFLEIRAKWDPAGLFPTYTKYVATSSKMASVWKQG